MVPWTPARAPCSTVPGSLWYIKSELLERVLALFIKGDSMVGRTIGQAGGVDVGEEDVRDV
jgi:hypothetical protein